MAYQSGADPIRTMEFLSAGAKRITGYEAWDLMADGRPGFTDLILDADRERVRDALRDAKEEKASWDLEYRIRNAEGDQRWVWDRGHVILSDEGEVLGLEGFVTDVTDRKALEESLLQSQKLEALGELTGSIAHDFNNLLTAIIAPIELLLDRLEPTERIARELTEVNETAHYAASLTQQLLAYSRKQAPLRRVVDVRQVVTLIQPTLERIVGERIDLVVKAADLPLPAYVDPTYLEQVVVNLVVNARDAQARGGEIVVSTGEAELTDQTAAPLGVAPGQYATLSVEDRGVGIPAEVLGRIFEPFFTTKESGTGLGLATVYGMVAQHLGAVDVRSREGEGSTFTVYLPLIDAPVEDLAALRARRPRATGTGSVLLVEDDDRVREALAEALRRYGYMVLSAKDGATARARATESAGKVDVIVSDILLEDCVGPELVADLRKELLPEAHVVYVTGYADEEAWRRIEEEPGALVLQKPFSLAQLLDAVGSEPAPRP
jgi:two-component system cell cycle sensor histidine kinase/response regulator CckA